jgi:Fe-S cluster biogenesis protein NfuA
VTQEAGTPDQSLEQRARELVEGFKPYIQRDGGDIEFVSWDDGIVNVRLHGACTSCPHASMTLRMGVERQLKQQMPEVKEVVNVG